MESFQPIAENGCKESPDYRTFLLRTALSVPKFPLEPFSVPVLTPRVPAQALDAFGGLGAVKDVLIQLRNSPSHELEKTLHPLERDVVAANAPIILQSAKPVAHDLQELIKQARAGWDSLHHFRFEPLHTYEEALVYRYVYVPLAYRLGYYTLAAKLAQMTFETLLPNIEERVRTNVRRVLGVSEAEAHSLAHRYFTDDASAAYCYSRPKTPHSIWQKAGSAECLEHMTAAEFQKQIDDYIGIAWIVRPKLGESRLSAIDRAARAFHENQAKGGHAGPCLTEPPDRFPVTMVHTVWRGIPVEVQFLGGDLLGYLTAMDYCMYKVGTSLDGIERKLSPDEWRRRGNTMLRIYEEAPLDAYEEGLHPEYHKLLLDELLERPVAYDGVSRSVCLSTNASPSLPVAHVSPNVGPCLSPSHQA